jgi:hypothetical protein
MFAVDNILISDDLLDAPFACQLGGCHGACCVVGDSGAPLEREELDRLDEVLPVVAHRLRPAALEVIAEKGTWEEVSPDQFATTCVGKAECVFVIYEGPVAKCAIQTAYFEGRTDFPKPISCHLYPIRIEDLGDWDAINYEKVDICRPGVRSGQRSATQLSDYLEEPLVRRFGQEWYDRFLTTIEERRSVLSDNQQGGR